MESESAGVAGRETSLDDPGAEALELAYLTPEDEVPASHPAVKLGAPLAVLCLIQAVLQVDASIVNLGLKSIQSGLGFSPTGLQWVATGYALTFGSLLMVGGRLGDAIGRRRLLVSALVVFGLASLACGLAGDPTLLVAGRFVQGAAGAMLAPTVLAMIAALHEEGPARVRAMGIWAGSMAVGGTTGVALGGILADAFGWRSIFLVNLPIIAVLLVAAVRVLPEIRGEHKRRLDPGGAAFLSLAIAALIYGVTSGEQRGFGSVDAWGALVVSALLTTAFVVNESRVPEPMVPLWFLAEPVRRTCSLTMFLLGGVLAGYMYFIALALQLVLDFSPAHAGLCLVPNGFVMFGSSFLLSHRAIGRFGVKRILMVGIAIQAVALLGLARVDGDTAFFTELMPPLLLNAFGMGLVFPAISIGITNNAGPTEMGIAAGLVPASQQIGAAAVLAVLATIAAAVSSGGSLASGYRVGFVVAAGITAAAGLLVARTRFDSSLN